MPVAVDEAGSAACARGVDVLGFIRWIAAIFRFPRPTPRSGDPVATPATLGSDFGGPATPVDPVQSVPELGSAPFHSISEREVPHENGDHAGEIVPGGTVPIAHCEIVKAAEPARDNPDSFLTNSLDPAVDDASDFSASAEMKESGLSDEGDVLSALAVGDGGTGDTWDEGEASPHTSSYHHGSVVSGQPAPPVLFSPTMSDAHAIGEEPAPLPTSDDPAGESEAARKGEAWTRVPDPSPAPTPTVSGASATLDDPPKVGPDDGPSDEPALANDMPLTADCVELQGAPAVEENTACADSVTTANVPVEHETVGSCDDGTIDEESIDSPGEHRKPNERREEVEEQFAADALNEEGAQDLRTAAEDYPVSLQLPVPSDAARVGEVGEAPPQSDHELDSDVTIQDSTGASESTPTQSDVGKADEAEASHNVLGELPVELAPEVVSLSGTVTAALMSRPGEYRPRLKRSRTRRAPASSAAAAGGGDIQNLSADLLLLIGAADWGVQLSALLRTPEGIEDEVAVNQGGVETWLGQLDDQLLEPLALTDASAAFGEPLLVTAVGLSARWSRTSRDLHVLGPHTRVAGFASQARVVIGQESVVICREGLVDAARAQILSTGSANPVPIEGPNVPSGWVCWRGVRPVRPSSPVGGQAILDALDPLPAVSIELSGGVQLSRGAWLEGHPPSIRLLGLLSEADPVLIDGTPASPGHDGGWTAGGWDAPGLHSIHHGGKSAGYSILPGAGAWDWWPAWDGPTRLAGTLSDAEGREYFHHSGPATLLGARPGQICGFVPSAFGIGVARPEFEPVWLLTAAPGVRRGSAFVIGSAPPPGKPIGSREAIERWVRAVCGSGRAGADRSEERAAWSGYLAAARSHRKRRK